MKCLEIKDGSLFAIPFKDRKQAMAWWERVKELNLVVCVVELFSPAERLP